MLLLLFSVLSLISQALGNHEDSCGIYPPCSDEGVFQILEDCTKYVICDRDGQGGWNQQNMVCPGDLVYAEEYGECVEWDRATECKNFQNTPCFISCPRVYLESTGYALEYQEFRLGCFRLSGSYSGGMPYYKSGFNGQFLAPDQYSTVARVAWLVGESFGATNGGIKNDKFDWVRCPFTGWNQGWEADKGLGHWLEDNTFKTTCYSGDQGGPTGTPGTTTTPAVTTTRPQDTTTTTKPQDTTTTRTTVTYPPSECEHDGPNKVGVCTSDFNCCRSLSGTNWEVTKCHCLNDLVYDEDFQICSWEGSVDACGKEQPTTRNMTRKSYECDGGKQCPGM